MYYIYDTCATHARSINRTTSGLTRIHTHTLTHTHTHTHAHTHTTPTRLVLRITLNQHTSPYNIYTEQLLGKLIYIYIYTHTHTLNLRDLCYASTYTKIHQQNNFWANLHIHTCATHQLTSKYITLQYIHIERLLMMKHQHVSSSSYDMYPAPHMREATHDETSTCILLLI